MSSPAPNTLIIIPAYNESASIEQVIADVRCAVPDAAVAVINDCSADDTAGRAARAGAQVLNLPCNLGIGGAVQTGYKFARQQEYDIAVQVDGDGQHPASQIRPLIDAVASGSADMAIGSRYISGGGRDRNFSRAMGKLMLAGVLTAITGQRITDSSSGFRAANRRVIAILAEYYPRDYPEPETVALLIREGFRVREIAVNMEERRSGRSSITFLKGIYYVIKVIISAIINTFKKRILR